MKIKLLTLLLGLVLILTGCNSNKGEKENQSNQGLPDTSESDTQGDVADLGDDDKTFGDSLDDLYVYDGYFEGESYIPR